MINMVSGQENRNGKEIEGMKACLCASGESLKNSKKDTVHGSLIKNSTALMVELLIHC